MAEPSDDIPLGRLRGYVSAVVGCAPERIGAATRFEEGNRHAVYQVSYAGADGALEQVVVRVSYGHQPQDRAQAGREAAVLEAVAGTAAPRLYDFSPSGPWFDTPTMCMQFVDGHPIELSSARPDEIRALGSTLAWVHGRPAVGLADRGLEAGDLVSYAEGRLESILHRLAWVRDPLPSPVQTGLRRIADSLRAGWEPARRSAGFLTGEPLVLLHGDVGPGNVLWCPDPVLIDWEYSRLGDPADEIAYLFDQNGLSADQREVFWTGYRTGSEQPELFHHVAARVDWWLPVTLLGSALWWVERWVRRIGADGTGEVDPEVPRSPDYYLQRVLERLHRVERPQARP
ncbi:MAG TPA: phosphotransferase [Acidimicrobiales bacterium]|nr:phosphotransferase [Acidimicrobiales bacterium]